jgi:Na+-translocating ferredoxin:NAD+ oxidoreductase RnfG subunit
MKNQNKKIIILLIIVIVLATGLFLLNKYNEEKKTELFQLRKNIKTYEVLPANSEIEKNIKDVDEKISLIDPYLFDINNPVLFIETIEDLADKNNTTAFVEDAQTTNFDGLGGEISLVVIAEGELEDLRNVLFDVEGLQKEISVSSVRLNKVNAEQGSFWRMIFNVKVKAK